MAEATEKVAARKVFPPDGLTDAELAATSGRYDYGKGRVHRPEVPTSTPDTTPVRPAKGGARR